MPLKDPSTNYLEDALSQGYQKVNPPLLCDASPLFFHLGESVQSQFFVGHVSTGKRYLLRPDITLSLCMLFSQKTSMDKTIFSQKWVYDSSAFIAHNYDNHVQEIVEKRQVGIEIFNHENTLSMDMEALQWVLKNLASVDYTLYLSHLGVLDAFVDALPINALWHKRLKRVLRMGNKRTLAELQQHSSMSKRGNDALRSLKHYDMKRDLIFASDIPLMGVRTRNEIIYRYEQNKISLTSSIFELIKQFFSLVAPPYEALEKLTLLGKQFHIEQRIKPVLEEMRKYCESIELLNLPEKTFFSVLPSGALSYYSGSLFSCHAYISKNEKRIIAGGGNYSHLLRSFTGRSNDCSSGATLYIEELNTIPQSNG